MDPEWATSKSCELLHTSGVRPLNSSDDVVGCDPSPLATALGFEEGSPGTVPRLTACGQASFLGIQDG